MSLDTPWQIEQTWGSNQAVIKGVLAGVKPKSALECGCGYFSTPLLRAGTNSLRTVEHDGAWMRTVQKDLPASKDHEYLHFPMAGVKNWTPREDVGNGLLDKARDFYRHIVAGDGFWDFVLIDTFRSMRVIAASVLMDHTNLMMLHDVRPCSRDYYNYDNLADAMGQWHRYEHRPDGLWINGSHYVPWTALYSRAPLDLDALNPAVIAESERLWGLSVGLEEIHGL